MPHNPIRVVVGPANYSTANAPLLRRKPNFRQRLDCQGQSIFCFAVIAAKAMYNNWRLSPVTTAAW